MHHQEAEEDDLHTSQVRFFLDVVAPPLPVSSLDTVDLAQILMKSVPKFFHGVYRFAMRQALDAVRKGHEERNEMKLIRGRKLFFLVPRLLFRPRRGGSVPKEAVGGQSGLVPER